MFTAPSKGITTTLIEMTDAPEPMFRLDRGQIEEDGNKLFGCSVMQ